MKHVLASSRQAEQEQATPAPAANTCLSLEEEDNRSKARHVAGRHATPPPAALLHPTPAAKVGISIPHACEAQTYTCCCCCCDNALSRPFFARAPAQIRVHPQATPYPLPKLWHMTIRAHRHRSRARLQLAHLPHCQWPGRTSRRIRARR